MLEDTLFLTFPGNMKRLFNVFVLAMVIMLNGCRSIPGPTLYQPIDRSGFGYRDHSIEGGKLYYVEFTGNPQTPEPLVEEYGHRRAQEICEQHGYKGYTICEEHKERWEPATDTHAVRSRRTRQDSGERSQLHTTPTTPQSIETGPRWFGEVECQKNE